MFFIGYNVKETFYSIIFLNVLKPFFSLGYMNIIGTFHYINIMGAILLMFSKPSKHPVCKM